MKLTKKCTCKAIGLEKCDCHCTVCKIRNKKCNICNKKQSVGTKYMKKYEVEVREMLSRIIKVEANTMEEAEEKVEEMYKNSEIVLNSNDMVADADIEGISRICSICEQPEDDDGRCGCTNKDALGI